MLYIFSTPMLIRHPWQHKTVVILHWCLICAVLLIKVMELFNSRAQPLHSAAQGKTWIKCMIENLVNRSQLTEIPVTIWYNGRRQPISSTRSTHRQNYVMSTHQHQTDRQCQLVDSYKYKHKWPTN